MNLNIPRPQDDSSRMMKAEHGGNVWLSNGKRGPFHDFSANIWPYPLSQSAVDRCMKNLDVYPDPDCRGLVSAAATYYGLEECQVFPANGSTEALYLAMLTLKPRKVAILHPTFSEYAKAARWAASSEVEILNVLADPQHGFRPTLAVPKADVVVLCNPNNPTGVFLSSREFMPWLDACAKSEVFVIVDEAFIEFVGDCGASIISELSTMRNVAVLRSMTKYFGIPGIRLGFALGSAEFIAALTEHRIPWSVNTVAQQLGICITTDGSAHRPEILETVARERSFLAAGLREFGWKVLPSAANFVLCQLPSGCSTPQLLPKLLNHGFVLRDASNFPGLDDSYLRCAIKGRPENQALLQAIARCK